MKTLHTTSFSIDPSGVDPLLEAVTAAFQLSPGVAAVRHVTYYDTFDWRLYNQGLRLLTEQAEGRRDPVCRLEGDGPPLELEGGELRDGRPGFAWELPPGPLRDRLEPVLDMRRPLPLAEATVESTAWRVLDEERKTVVRLRLESAQTRCPGEEESSPLRSRLELEPVRGYDKDAEKLRRFLEKELELERIDRTRFDEAAAACGLEPGSYSSKIRLELSPGTSAQDAARQIHLQLLKAVELNEEGTRKDLDSEFLHDFRVAVRRTRAALSQVKRVFPQDRVDYFKGELSWLGKLTGPTRDLDVYLLKMPAYRADLPPEARQDLVPLERFLEKKQRQEQKKLAAQLDSDRYRRLVADWRDFLEQVDDPTPRNAERSAREVAAERIWKVYRRILKRGGSIRETDPAERLHDVRLECKKLRYLMELFRSLFPADIEPSIKELKRLQDNLGDFNDYEVQQAALGDFAEEMAKSDSIPAATLLAMGRLQSHLEEGQEKERRSFAQKFARFSSAKNRRRFERLFKAP